MKKKSTYCGIIQIRGVQCSWVNKFLQVRGDVISWVSYAMSPGKRTLIYKLRKELSFFYFIMLQNRVIFRVNTSMLPVITGK